MSVDLIKAVNTRHIKIDIIAKLKSRCKVFLQQNYDLDIPKMCKYIRIRNTIPNLESNFVGNICFNFMWRKNINFKLFLNKYKFAYNAFKIQNLCGRTQQLNYYIEFGFLSLE